MSTFFDNYIDEDGFFIAYKAPPEVKDLITNLSDILGKGTVKRINEFSATPLNNVPHKAITIGNISGPEKELRIQVGKKPYHINGEPIFPATGCMDVIIGPKSARIQVSGQEALDKFSETATKNPSMKEVTEAFKNTIISLGLNTVIIGSSSNKPIPCAS